MLASSGGTAEITLPLHQTANDQPGNAWLLSRGARVSQFLQTSILHKVNRWRAERDKILGNIWDALTLPFALWHRV